MYVDAKELEMAFISAVAKDMCDYGEDITLSAIVLTFDGVIEAFENKVPDTKPKNNANAGTGVKRSPDYSAGVCEYCGKSYKKNSGNQKLCPECKEKKKKSGKELLNFLRKAHSTSDMALEHINGSTSGDIKNLAHELVGMENE